MNVKPVQHETETDAEFSLRKAKWEAQQREAKRAAVDKGKHESPLVKFARVWNS